MLKDPPPHVSRACDSYLNHEIKSWDEVVCACVCEEKQVVDRSFSSADGKNLILLSKLHNRYLNTDELLNHLICCVY